MKIGITAFLFCLLSPLLAGCEDAELRKHESRPSDSEEGVDGYLSETSQFVPAREAATLTISNTTVEIAGGTTSEDSVVRLRHQKETPAENEALEMGAALGDIINIAFVAESDATILGSKILEQTFTVKQIITHPEDLADLKMVVITDPGSEQEKTTIIKSKGITIEEGQTGALMATITASVEADYTHATLWFVESKTVPLSVIVSTSGVVSSADDTEEEEEVIPAGPTVIQITYASQEDEIIHRTLSENTLGEKNVLAAADHQLVSVINRDSQTPDLVSIWGNPLKVLFHSYSGNAWQSDEINSNAKGDMSLAAIAIDNTRSLVLGLDGSESSNFGVIWNKSDKSIQGLNSSLVETIDVGQKEFLAGFKDSYVIAGVFGPSHKFAKLNAQATHFEDFGTSGNPAWGSEDDYYFSSNAYLRPIGTNLVGVAGEFEDDQNRIHAGIVIGEVDSQNHQFYDLGLCADNQGFVFASNSQGEIATAFKITESHDTLRVKVKLKNQTEFSTLADLVLPELERGTTQAFYDIKIGIDNKSIVHLVYTTDLFLIYKNYVDGAWSDSLRIVENESTSPSIFGFHIEGTPGRGGYQ